MKKLLLMIAAVLVIGASEACAQWGSLGYGYFGNSFTAGTVVPPSNLQDRVPYFSLFPPVYYSYPVPRPYGYSPFAYPGWTPTPHVESVEPQTVVNPYINGESVRPAEPKSPQAAPSSKSTSHRQAAVFRTKTTGPLRIVNPYAGDIVAGNSK